MTLAMGVTAQESETETTDNEEKRMEIIKIIDGDTVVHKVTKIRGIDASNCDPETRMQRMEDRRVMMDVELQELNGEIEQMLKDLDIYVNVDDMHKKMIIRRMMSDGDMQEVIQSLDSNDDIVIDFEDGRRKMKVMKIQINHDDMEEIKTMDMGPGRGPGKGKGRMKGVSGGMGAGSNGIKAYPNPAKDEVNIEFEVQKGNAEVTVRDMNGQVIFEKTYADKGTYKEKVKLKDNAGKVLIIQLKEEGRIERRKIIAD